jgi:hypothetical protein
MEKRKKTIRLTESEMISMIERIVNEVKREKRNQIAESRRRNNVRLGRVIREQEEETKGLLPKSFTEVNLSGGKIVKITQKDSIRTPIDWTITPSQAMRKDDNQKMVPIPNTLSLWISSSEFKNTKVAVNVNCDDKKVSYRAKVVADDYEKVFVNYMDREFSGSKAKNLLLQSMHSEDWKYIGPIKEMGDEYCQKIKS